MSLLLKRSLAIGTKYLCGADEGQVADGYWWCVDKARVDSFEIGIEVAGLGLQVCPARFASRLAIEKLTLGIGGGPAGDDQPGRRVDGLLDA
jgi:hypothetical protein